MRKELEKKKKKIEGEEVEQKLRFGWESLIESDI